MPAINENDLVEVRINYVQNGQRLLNVFHYKAVNVMSELDYEAAMDYATDQLATETTLWPQVWKDEASDTCAIYKIDAQVIFPTRLYHISKLVDIPGLIDDTTSPALPQNVQLSLTKVSAATGRGRTGRIEVPGGNIDLVTEGRLSASGITYMEALATAVQQNVSLESLNPSELVPVILYGFAPAGSPNIELVRVQDTVRVSRRRTVGVGE